MLRNSSPGFQQNYSDKKLPNVEKARLHYVNTRKGQLYLNFDIYASRKIQSHQHIDGF
jgi:hypothetical protein